MRLPQEFDCFAASHELSYRYAKVNAPSPIDSKPTHYQAQSQQPSLSLSKVDFLTMLQAKLPPICPATKACMHAE